MNPSASTWSEESASIALLKADLSSHTFCLVFSIELIIMGSVEVVSAHRARPTRAYARALLALGSANLYRLYLRQ